MKSGIQTIIKYFLCIAYGFIIFLAARGGLRLISYVVEISLIFVITYLLLPPRSEECTSKSNNAISDNPENNHKKIDKIRLILANLVNIILILLLNIQMLFVYFARSYITLVMLTNLDSLEDISGNAVRYILGIIVVLAISFIPIYKTKCAVQRALYIGIVLILAGSEAFILIHYNGVTSPAYSYADLGIKYHQKKQYDAMWVIDTSEDKTHLFYKDSVSDYIQSPDELSDNPNIILILTEGMSANIIDDDRKVMPRLAEIRDKSISFDNYFNHTFATYRGISGQLFSGYQKNNTDTNSLVSLQSVLSDRGYHTIYINTEPQNETFTNYVNSLGFDDVITGPTSKDNTVESVSDKESYKLLYDTIKTESSSGQPYLIVMYTFQTHTSFDSVDERYGNGKNAFYNKFYNTDYQLGQFFDKWSYSSLSDNSLLVLTTDHATYMDESYTTAFPEYSNTRPVGVLDEMPLIMWHKGVAPKTIDVGGRNTLSLTPTILDYTDISAPNYFLGDSLFSGANVTSENIYDTLFAEESFIFSTADGYITSFTDEEATEKWLEVYKYFTAKLQEPKTP